jgi:hypothetical protein
MPINENFEIPKKEKAEYPPIPEGIHQVELLDVSVEERPTYDTRNKEDDQKVYEKVFKFQFTLLQGKDGENDLRGRNTWENFVPAYLYIGKNGKNKLYQITEALIGRELTQEEEATFQASELNKLIGKQCIIGIKHKKTDKGTYDNIESFYKAGQPLPSLTEEEKENARVKKEDEPKSPADSMREGMSRTTDQDIEMAVENIPFG